MDATEINLTRIVRAPRKKVFDAWTEARQIEKWWGPGPVTCPAAGVDLKPGGHYFIENLAPDGTRTVFRGEFELVDVPNKLVYSWFINAEPTGANGSRVTVEFRDHPDGTEILLRHERLPTPEVIAMHLEGWEGCLDGLEDYLAAN